MTHCFLYFVKYHVANPIHHSGHKAITCTAAIAAVVCLGQDILVPILFQIGCHLKTRMFSQPYYFIHSLIIRKAILYWCTNVFFILEYCKIKRNLHYQFSESVWAVVSEPNYFLFIIIWFKQSCIPWISVWMVSEHFECLK